MDRQIVLKIHSMLLHIYHSCFLLSAWLSAMLSILCFRKGYTLYNIFSHFAVIVVDQDFCSRYFLIKLFSFQKGLKLHNKYFMQLHAVYTMILKIDFFSVHWYAWKNWNSYGRFVRFCWAWIYLISNIYFIFRIFYSHKQSMKSTRIL